ncbi:MAG: sigma factor [Pseudomonadota bacterium]|nr:sigma factor [Pseudomonadota bacterium]
MRWRRCSDPDRAEDLVQETLARALERMHFWRAGSNPRAWLFTIMHNQFANDCHRGARRPTRAALYEDSVEPGHGRRRGAGCFCRDRSHRELRC